MQRMEFKFYLECTGYSFQIENSGLAFVRSKILILMYGKSYSFSSLLVIDPG